MMTLPTQRNSTTTTTTTTTSVVTILGGSSSSMTEQDITTPLPPVQRVLARRRRRFTIGASSSRRMNDVLLWWWWWWWWCGCGLLFQRAVMVVQAQQQQQQQQPPPSSLRFESLPSCSLTSLEFSKLPSGVSVEPCILYDIQPPPTPAVTKTNEGERNNTIFTNSTTNDNNTATTSTSTTTIRTSSTIITTVQVTPVGCAPHRDGAVTAARVLNADNDQKGVAIGFGPDVAGAFVQFRHVSIIAGNPAALGTAVYNERHVQLLEQAVQALNASYIAGTCSFAAALEKEPARRLQRMVLTMVGPPGFYKDDDSRSSGVVGEPEDGAINSNKGNDVNVNPYVFGLHINSDTYGRPAIQQLSFIPNGPTKIPIRVVYRKESEFFRSTCQAILDEARAMGFVDVESVLYKHDDDHDGDGTINQYDEDFLGLLADQICPSSTKIDDGGGDDGRVSQNDFRPAIFACTLTEQDLLLARWRKNGCRPYSMWMTPSTWEWALNNPEVVPYFQGGGQWHPAFSYGDKYFDTGADLLEYNEPIFGYRGSYDMVVSYAMVVLFAQHLQAAYRIVDNPDPAADFATPEGYERLRRDMIILNVETIFGTVSFNEYQRNEGRGAAGTQWLPQISNGVNNTELSNDGTMPTTIENFLVSPFLQAERAAVTPAPVAEPCEAGSFDNNTRTKVEESLLLEKCSLCPIDTFAATPNLGHECQVCPSGATTNFLQGQTFCSRVDDNLVGVELHILGNFGVLCTWILAILFGSWTVRHRKDPVVAIGQPEFLLTICFAAMVSSSSVIFLSFEASSGDSERWADFACKMAPFLYAAGWVTEYSSLSVKTYRLFRITNNSSFRRVQIHSYQMFIFVVLFLAIDLTLIFLMTIFTPLEYTREVTNRDVTDNVVTLKTSGTCASDSDAWAFLGPIVALHVCLQLGTNWLLFKVRGVADRYQEQKYVGLASLFVLEILAVGVPVLIAVQDSPAARYIVMAAIVVFNDIGILCFVFLPKMRYQKEGLPEGVGVGESINRSVMRRAMSRRSTSLNQAGQFGPAGTVRGSLRPSSRSAVPAVNSSIISPDEEDTEKQFSTHSSRSERRATGSRLGFNNSLSENLDSIQERSGDVSMCSRDFSRPSVSASDNNNAVSTNAKNLSTTKATAHHGLPATENVLFEAIQARVREKLAKRLAAAEQNNAECALVVDENTAGAVGALSDNFELNGASISSDVDIDSDAEAHSQPVRHLHR